MNLRDFIPPIIIKGLKKFYPSNKKIGIEEVKEYSSYEEAQSVCSKGAYQDIELCNMVADKTVIFRDSLFTLDSTNVFLLAAINHLRFTLNSLTILDFGGACGAHYFEKVFT